jgi:hypothetical protein
MEILDKSEAKEEGPKRTGTAGLVKINKVSLCKYSTKPPNTMGLCPIHGTTDCLSMYVRYNWFMEIIERSWKETKIVARQWV